MTEEELKEKLDKLITRVIRGGFISLPITYQSSFFNLYCLLEDEEAKKEVKNYLYNGVPIIFDKDILNPYIVNPNFLFKNNTFFKDV